MEHYLRQLAGPSESQTNEEQNALIVIEFRDKSRKKFQQIVLFFKERKMKAFMHNVTISDFFNL